MLKHVIIESDRLKQVPITADYIEIIYHTFTKEVTTYMYPKAPDEIGETEKFVLDSIKGLENGRNLQMVILSKDTHEFIGCCGLHQYHTNIPEIGIWIKKDAHGHGYGLEAVSALIEWARKHREIEYFRYPVDRRNIASRRIPEAHGGTMIEGRKIMNMSGFELDIVNYCIKGNKN